MLSQAPHRGRIKPLSRAADALGHQHLALRLELVQQLVEAAVVGPMHDVGQLMQHGHHQALIRVEAPATATPSCRGSQADFDLQCVAAVATADVQAQQVGVAVVGRQGARNFQQVCRVLLSRASLA